MQALLHKLMAVITNLLLREVRFHLAASTMVTFEAVKFLVEVAVSWMSTRFDRFGGTLALTDAIPALIYKAITREYLNSAYGSCESQPTRSDRFDEYSTQSPLVVCSSRQSIRMT